jgi:hypothetical protein
VFGVDWDLSRVAYSTYVSRAKSAHNCFVWSQIHLPFVSLKTRLRYLSSDIFFSQILSTLVMGL